MYVHIVYTCVHISLVYVCIHNAISLKLSVDSTLEESYSASISDCSTSTDERSARTILNALKKLMWISQ